MRVPRLETLDDEQLRDLVGVEVDLSLFGAYIGRAPLTTVERRGGVVVVRADVDESRAVGAR